MPDGFDATPTVAQDALEGLLQSPKTLPAKLFYDDVGCSIFEQITRLPEYYPTRTELALLQRVAPSFSDGAPVALVEYGASSEAKAAILLGGLPTAVYVPIDVADNALKAIVRRMRLTHPDLPVHPIHGDFLKPVVLPPMVANYNRLGFFPGSTIGNLDPSAARGFLTVARETLGEGSRFLIGVDLRKSESILIPAYDDAQGVTAAFNLNLLARLNREADAAFDLHAFQHRAKWNEAEGRVEMHLVSLINQSVVLAGQTLTFEAGETIHTENSYKHTNDGFKALASRSGWTSENVWTDSAAMFSLHLLRRTD